MKLFKKPKCFVCGKEIDLFKGYVDRVDKYLPLEFVKKANKFKMGLWTDVHVHKECLKKGGKL